MTYDTTNRGTLGKNNRKTEESHPDYSGKINVAGVDYWLSGWLKEGPTGKFFSLSVKAKDQQQRQEAPRDNRPLAHSINDDIPFAPEFR